MEKESRSCVAAGHWSLDLSLSVRNPHVCPLIGGAREHSLKMQEEGRWPPPAPVFETHNSRDDYSLFYRWVRHVWIECDANIGTNAFVEGDAGLGKTLFLAKIAILDAPRVSVSRQFCYKRQTFLDRVYDATTPNESVFGDEALTRMIWGKDSMRSEQSGFFKDVWEMARRNKKKLYYSGQDSKSGERIARSGIMNWWLVLDKRSGDGRNQGWILSGVRTAKYDKKAKGYEMERPLRYRMLGDFMVWSLEADAAAFVKRETDRLLQREEEEVAYVVRD